MRYINSHAVFMEYLSRVVAGLRVLIFTWSTVVLLGGFVSLLGKKDFWFLTVITLCQTKEYVSPCTFANTFAAYSILLFSLLNLARRQGLISLNISTEHQIRTRWFATAFNTCLEQCEFTVPRATLTLFRLIVFTSIVSPLLIIYTFGMYISTAISLYRLTRRDLGLGVSSGADGGDVHPLPALHVLYLLALVQGVLYFYRMTFISTGRKMEWIVAKRYRLKDYYYWFNSPMFQYAAETRAGCTNDPSFVKGRNLVTYAVGLIQSASPDTERLLCGVTMMDTLLLGQRDLLRQLVISSTSSAHIQGKLLEIVSPSSAATDKYIVKMRKRIGEELRERAERILTYFAGDIRLSKLAGGIESISCMLEL
uniref:Uncharacterized protein n=1 Tax=Oryza punctata TaxID=4537 RepID=A0A0E0MNC7_ORYPU